MTYVLIVAVVALLAFAGVGGGTAKRGRPKGSHNAPRKSAAERFAALFARIPSMVWSLLREAMDKNKAGYVPSIHKAAEGLARCRRDSKKFAQYGNPVTCAAKVRSLRERADRIEAFGNAIREGTLQASTAIAAGDAAFAAVAEKVKMGMVAGEEVALGDIFSECFPPATLRLLNEYVETDDPFKGSDDETDDDADDEPNGDEPTDEPTEG